MASPQCSSLYRHLVRLHSEKAADTTLTGSFPRPHGARRTLWRYELLIAAVTREMPALDATLKAQQQLAAQPCTLSGMTPLHVASFLGVPSLVAALLRAGAPADAASVSGRTPFDEALFNGNVEVLVLLLDALPLRSRPALRRRIQRYAALPGAALAPSAVVAAGLLPAGAAPPVRRAARVDAMQASVDDAGAGCGGGGGWVEAPVQETAEHSDTDQRDALSEEEYYEEYYLQNRPVLLRGAMSLRERCAFSTDRWSRTELEGSQPWRELPRPALAARVTHA